MTCNCLQRFWSCTNVEKALYQVNTLLLLLLLFITIDGIIESVENGSRGRAECWNMQIDSHLHSTNWWPPIRLIIDSLFTRPIRMTTPRVLHIESTRFLLLWFDQWEAACYLLVNGRVENGEQRERYEIHDHEVKGDDVARDVRLIVAQRRWYYLQNEQTALNRAKAITFNQHKESHTIRNVVALNAQRLI